MMNPAYLETRFFLDPLVAELPVAFAIITAHATTGEAWSAERNQAADEHLRVQLIAKGALIGRITGYSPSTGHAEPGWAATVDFDDACDIGQAFAQDAIYFVTGGDLFVSRCDDRRALTYVARFGDRLDAGRSIDGGRESDQASQTTIPVSAEEDEDPCRCPYCESHGDCEHLLALFESSGFGWEMHSGEAFAFYETRICGDEEGDEDGSKIQQRFARFRQACETAAAKTTEYEIESQPGFSGRFFAHWVEDTDDALAAVQRLVDS